MKPLKPIQLSPATPRFNVQQPVQASLTHMAPGQLAPTTDLHKIALSVAMSNILKRKKPQQSL